MPSERAQVARHAATVLAGQLAVMAFGVTDTIVAGRHAPSSLAALSIGSAVYVSVYVALMGVLLQALLPIWAEQRGAGHTTEIGRTVRQALYLCALASLLGMVVLLSPGAILRWTQVPAELRAEVGRYLTVLAAALPPALAFRLYTTLNQALGRPQLVTWLQLGSLAVKIPLSIGFTFGFAGLPAQGAVGCAWATLVVNYLLLGIALWLVRSSPVYAPLSLWKRMERPDPAQIGHFARLGVPAGLAVMVEVTSFTLMALFIARQGTVAAAAHQIASNLTAVLYMVPLSLAIATSARISYWRGRADEAPRPAGGVDGAAHGGRHRPRPVGDWPSRHAKAWRASIRPHPRCWRWPAGCWPGPRPTTSPMRCRPSAHSPCAATGSPSLRWPLTGYCSGAPGCRRAMYWPTWASPDIRRSSRPPPSGSAGRWRWD